MVSIVVCISTKALVITKLQSTVAILNIGTSIIIMEGQAN